MTLEQAINHLEEELKIKEDWSCVACKEEHQQLLSWLKELQAIKSAEPSEALKALNTIAFNTQFIAGMNFGDELRTIENYILKAQEQERIIDELKTLIKRADLSKQKIISLEVLKNTLKEVL